MVDEQRRAGSTGPPVDSTEFLESVVVEQEVGPTRCTIYPPAVPESEQTTTWLSADFAVFVSLDDAR